MDIESLSSEKDLVFGRKEVFKKVRNGELTKVIYSSRIPSVMKEKLLEFTQVADIDIEEFEGSPKELGTACKRPHIVSIVGIEE